MAKSILEIIDGGVPKPYDGAHDYVEANFSLGAVTNMYGDWYREILQTS
jgi:hypothetical protein